MVLLAFLCLGCPSSWAQAPPATLATPAAVSKPAPAAGASAPAVGTKASPVPVASPGTAVTAPPAAAASPAPVAPGGPSPAATPAEGELHLPTQSDRDALAQWKKTGVVGRSTFVDKVRTVTWVLAFVCFLVWLAGKFVGKATLEKFGLPAEADTLIEVLEKKKLSPGRSIMLLRVGPKVLAVAVTENGFRTLTEIDSEALKLHQDERVEASPVVVDPPQGQGPADIAKHYLSIIPGLGAKK